jgi:hypothetical protein
MANPKNTKPTTPADDALLAALGEPAPAAPKPATKSPAVPAQPPVVVAADLDPAITIVKATAEKLSTPEGLIKALIEALGHSVDEVASIEIRRPGIIRVIGTDRSARSRRFEWPTTWEVAE